MKYFMAGIKGSGMSALATMLYDSGNEIIGYDDFKNKAVSEDELLKRNIKIYDNLENLTDDMIYVHTAAIHSDHKSYIKARELHIPIYSYYEMIGKLTREYDAICICGTHGKTTTTAMLSRVFENTIGANYIIGDGTGHLDKDSKLLVVESCEFERHFLAYSPKYAIVTNIDFDHVDCYKNIDEIIDVFQQFIDKVDKEIIACGDDKNIRKLKSNKITYYGFNDNNDVVAKNVSLNQYDSSFDVYIKGKFYDHFDIKLYGNHMILDALACIYMAYLKNIKKEDILDYLDTFHGAKRRFSEEIVNDCVLVDDYAHHPVEVETVLATARQKYPDKKVVAVLIPYTLSRTKAFYKEFAEVIKSADKAFVTDVEPAREKLEDYPNIDYHLIMNLVPNAEHISKAEIKKLYNYPNSVICFMGCKDSLYLRDSYRKGLVK